MERSPGFFGASFGWAFLTEWTGWGAMEACGKGAGIDADGAGMGTGGTEEEVSMKPGVGVVPSILLPQ